MASNVIQSLLYSIRLSELTFERACLVNGAFDLTLLDIFKPDNTDIVNPYYNHLQNFRSHNFTCHPTIQADHSCDFFAIFLPKQKDQALYDIASAINHAKNGTYIVLCAAKDAGGARLQKIAEAFGLDVAYSYSKYHCKSIVMQKTSSLKQETVDYCLNQGAFTTNKHGYHTKPGIYGWDKVDIGSQILADHLPETLSGRGADFGCGYGFLADKVLGKAENVDHLYCIDVDHHALKACKENLDERHPKRSYDIIWEDLTQNDSSMTSLSFVVMNPPFHEGKDADTSLGKNMITAAHDALGQYGELYMVANNHLPYETTLNDSFFQVTVLAQEKGFKIFKALK